MSEERKKEVELVLKKMNDLLFQMVHRSSITTPDFQQKTMFFLRSIASIREEMLQKVDPSIDTEIKKKVSLLEENALKLLSTSA